MSKQINLSLSDDLYALVEDAMLDGERISRTARRLLSERLTEVEVSDTSDPWAGLDKKLIDGWERLTYDLNSTDDDALTMTDEVRYRWRRWVADKIHTSRINTDPDPQYRLLVELGLTGVVEPVLHEITTRADAIQHLKWLHYIDEWLEPKTRRPRISLPDLPDLP